MKIYEKLKITRNSLKLRELEQNAKQEQQEHKDVEARAAWELALKNFKPSTTRIYQNQPCCPTHGRVIALPKRLECSWTACRYFFFEEHLKSICIYILFLGASKKYLYLDTFQKYLEQVWNVLQYNFQSIELFKYTCDNLLLYLLCPAKLVHYLSPLKILNIK